MCWKKGALDRDSPEYRSIETGKGMIEKTSGRWRASAILLDILDVLQGTSVNALARPRFRVEDWYRVRLGTFLYVNRDGVLCHTEHSSTFSRQLNSQGQRTPPSIPDELPESDACNGPGSCAIPMESLEYNDLIGESGSTGLFWPNPARGFDSGRQTSQTLDMTSDGDLDYAFYDDFLNQISTLAG